MNLHVRTRITGMEIKHVEKGSRGGFIVRGESGKRLAEMTYTTAGSRGIIIDHTDVHDSLRGQGVGEKLLGEAVNHARENGLKVYATCPFALGRLRKTSEYRDVFGG